MQFKLFAANPTFDSAGSHLKLRGGGTLIPYEDKWKIMKHSTSLFRGVGRLIPYEEKCRFINHSIQHICSEEVGDVIPYGD